MADPKSVWSEVYNIIAKFMSAPQIPRVLEQTETPIMPKRRTDFGMTYGEATGKVRKRPDLYIPGQLDVLAEQMGIASDDPYQLAAKLEAYKRWRKK